MTFDEWLKTPNGQLATSYRRLGHAIGPEACLRLAFDAGLDAALAVLEAESKRITDAAKAIDEEAKE